MSVPKLQAQQKVAAAVSGKFNSERPRAILHIGAEKTGTTFIQSYIRQNSADFLASGILVPMSGTLYEGSAHYMLTVQAASDDKIRDIVDKKEDLDNIRQKFASDLKFELTHVPEGVTQVLFSDELCHSRLTDADEVAKLKQFLDRFFSGYQIIVYIRRQDELAISAYNEYLHNGFSGKDLLRNDDGSPHYQRSYYDYLGLLRRWTDVFGQEAVFPRIYSRADFVAGNIISDFISIAAPCQPVRENELQSTTSFSSSFNVVGQALLQCFNEAFDDLTRMVGRRASSRMRKKIIRYLDKHCKGRGRRPSRDEAMNFLSEFAAENEKLRTEWFPGRTKLFSEDFSQYPETPGPEPNLTEIALLIFTIMGERKK